MVTSAASTDTASLSHKGWEEFTPLEENEITSQDKALDLPRPLDGKEASLLSISDPNVLLETWKPAEDGNGTILRLLEFGGRNSRTLAVATSLLKLEKATETDAVERNLRPLPLRQGEGFEVEIHPYEILTIRLEGKSKTRPAAE